MTLSVSGKGGGGGGGGWGGAVNAASSDSVFEDDAELDEAADKGILGPAVKSKERERGRERERERERAY